MRSTAAKFENDQSQGRDTLDKQGRRRWGTRKGVSLACLRCGKARKFVQDADGTVYSVCECGHTFPHWSAAGAYQVRRDSGACWRRAIRMVSHA